jgi:hypothetical protein
LSDHRLARDEFYGVSVRDLQVAERFLRLGRHRLPGEILTARFEVLHELRDFGSEAGMVRHGFRREKCRPEDNCETPGKPPWMTIGHEIR